MLEPEGCEVSWTFFLKRALRSEYPRLRVVGESGERFPVPRGETGETCVGTLLFPCAVLLPSPSGETSRVSMVRSGVPGLFFAPDAFPAGVPASICALCSAKLALRPGPCRSTSVEKRTRGEASEGRRDIEGREVCSIAKVRETGTSSGCLSECCWFEVAAGLRVVGDSSSWSCGAEYRLRIPPPPLPPWPAFGASGRSPAPEDIVVNPFHASCMR